MSGPKVPDLPTLGDVSCRIVDAAQLAELIEERAISGVEEEAANLGGPLATLARDLRRTVDLLDRIEVAAMKDTAAEVQS